MGVPTVGPDDQSTELMSAWTVLRTERDRLAEEVDRLRGWLDIRAGELIHANAQRDEARAEVDRLWRQLQGPYATWWILKSQPAQSDGYITEGVTVVGTTPLPEKIEHVRMLRRERPELGGWTLERVEQMHLRTVEEDPMQVLREWYPDLDDEAVAAILSELQAPGEVWS